MAQSRETQSREARSSDSAQVAQKLGVVGTPLHVQLRGAFANSVPEVASKKESARATRVPAEQRAVAEQIVLNRRRQLGRQFVDALGQQQRERQQQPTDSQLGGRHNDRVQVLFILNVVEKPAAPK